MTENKADKALRKVIINLIPQEKYGGPVVEDDLLKIDISDKLDDKHYCLENIKINYEDYGDTLSYIPFEDYRQFKIAVENILDATIVNSKQRESIQKLLNNAFYNSEKFDAVI